ncbi:hypothetical protein [Romboutsia ilealis]|jgi:hypothetical protein|uniref:hypothetical protein n=1 Tax=Romboutsia ilealis TaxID=1115758 RepID=UPI0026F396A3|nr:hypothetical protein [Romboutsia ilealis]
MDTEKYSEIEIFHMVLSGELKRYPNGFWVPPFGITYAVNILKYVIEDILKWNDNDIIEKYDINLFKKYKLCGLLANIFNNSPFEALNAVYPNRFHAWQLNKKPLRYWKDEKNVIEVVKHVYEDELGVVNTEEIYDIRDHKGIFDKYGIRAIPRIQNKSIHEIIIMAYPELCESGFHKRSNSFYTVENQLEVLKSWIETNNYKHDDIVKMTEESLKDIKLYATLVYKNNMGIYDIINTIYPGEFKPWEFPKIKRGFWKDDKNICEAVKWLIEEKLNIDTKDTIRISKEDFRRNSLTSLIQYAEINHIGLKTLMKMVYKDSNVVFKI